MKWLNVILFLSLLLIPIPLVSASEEDTVNLGDVPLKVSEALNVSLFVGQLLTSLIFMALFMFPAILIAGYFGGAGSVLYTIIFVGLGASGVCVALGWLPVWLYAIICLLIAGLWSTKFVKQLGGEET